MTLYNIRIICPYNILYVHDMIAPSIHLGDPILALWTFQYAIMLQVPAKAHKCTHDDGALAKRTWTLEKARNVHVLKTVLGESSLMRILA